MTEPSELVERLAAVVDPRFSDEFVGNMIRANWPDIHAALSAMPDPLAMAVAAAERAAVAAEKAQLGGRATGQRICAVIRAIDPATLEVNHATD